MEIDPDFFWFRLTAIVECIVLGEVCQIKVLGTGILPSSQVLLITNEGERGLDELLGTITWDPPKGKFWKSIIDSKRLVLGGSSQLGSVVNSHGDRFRLLRIGLLNDPLP